MDKRLANYVRSLNLDVNREKTLLNIIDNVLNASKQTTEEKENYIINTYLIEEDNVGNAVYLYNGYLSMPGNVKKLIVDDVEVEVNTKFVFNEVGEHTAKIVLNDNLTTLHSGFVGCQTLIKSDVTHLDLTNVTTLSGMYASCNNLSSVIGLEDLDIKNVTNISGMLTSTAITDVDLRKWDVRNVTAIYQFLDGNNAIKNINIDGWDLRNCTNSSNFVTSGNGGYFYYNSTYGDYSFIKAINSSLFTFIDTALMPATADKIGGVKTFESSLLNTSASTDEIITAFNNLIISMYNAGIISSY